MQEICSTEISFLRGLLTSLECYLRPISRIRDFFDDSQIPGFLQAEPVISEIFNRHRVLLSRIFQAMMSPVEEIDAAAFLRNFLESVSDDLFRVHLEYRDVHQMLKSEVDLIRFHQYPGWYQAIYEVRAT